MQTYRFQGEFMQSIESEETVHSEMIYAGKVISVRRDSVRTASGKVTQREIVEHAPVVVMIPETEDGNLLFVRQYRKAVEKELLELPAGGVEPGEDLEAAARREMIEETGYEPRTIQKIATVYPTPGISNETMHILVVSNLDGDGVPTEVDDQLILERHDLAGAVRMIHDGRIQDAKTIIGVCMLESRSLHNDLGDSE